MSNRHIPIVFILSLISVLLAAPYTRAQDNTLELPGRVALVTTDGNIRVLEMATATISQITTDAARNRRYSFPTWARGGSLAYFLNSAENNTLSLMAYVLDNGGTAGREIYAAENEFFQYAFWSPQACDSTNTCRDLAMLLSDGDTLKVQGVRDQATATAARSQVLGTGGPFYYSWSPDGTRMLWQRFGSALDVYELASGTVNALTQMPAQFNAPAWSPVDDRYLFTTPNAADPDSADLVIVSDGGAMTVLAQGLQGLTSFAWSADGNAVAYTQDYGRLIVVDAVSGAQIAATDADNVLAFFWSPDSQRIAYLTRSILEGTFSASVPRAPLVGGMALAQGKMSLVWSVLDVSANSSQRYVSFTPTAEMLYYISYFDQFAQSHRLWSPDGHYFLYSEVAADGTSVVSVLDATRLNAIPLVLDEGVFGVWSFE
jgi:TolB protein